MYKLEFFLLLIAIYLCRILFLKKNEHPAFLLISFFLVVVPLQVNIPFGKPEFKILSGSLGSQMYIFNTFLMFCCFLPLFAFRIKLELFSKDVRWIAVTLSLFLLSFANSNNDNINGTFIAFSFFISHILFFSLLFTNVSYNNLIKGITDGFVILGTLNFLLAICFPVLNLKAVTTLFHVTGDIGATRMGSHAREGAIGLFSHPGALALYSTISSIFFLFKILKNKGSQVSKLIFLLNLATIILTFSRTTFLVYALVIFLTYYIVKNPRTPIFSLKNVLRIFIPLGLVFLWLIVFSPLSDIFLESDVNAQFDNRTLHWLMAIEGFKQSPIFGVGLNTHLIYFSKHPTVLKNLELTPFFLENPIHNIHLILLVEVGIVGFLLWVWFLVTGISGAKKDISNGINPLLSVTKIGTIIVFIFYGLTGWAPLSLNILPYFLFIIYFASKYRLAPQSLQI